MKFKKDSEDFFHVLSIDKGCNFYTILKALGDQAYTQTMESKTWCEDHRHYYGILPQKLLFHNRHDVGWFIVKIRSLGHLPLLGVIFSLDAL